MSTPSLSAAPTRRAATRRRGRNLRRDRRLMAMFVTIGVGAATAAGLGVAEARQPPPNVIERSVASGPDGVLDLTFAGDTMMADGAERLIAAKGLPAMLTKIRPLITGDFFTLNAEAPLTTSRTPNNPGAKYSYAVRPEAATVLADAGVDGFALGNNHAMDRGTAGLADTLRAATGAGISSFGAGANREQARRPLVLRSGTQTVAYVGLGENFGPLHRSTDTSAGMVPLSPEEIEFGIHAAQRAGASKVVAVVHWGDNYQQVNAQQRYWAEQLVAAGYDAVIGSGSHTLQRIELVGGRPVVYGLGNFVFGAPGRYAGYGQLGLGAVVNLRWGADGAGSVRVHCVRTDNLVVDYVARPCTPAELEQAKPLVGPTVRWEGDVGLVSFR